MQVQQEVQMSEFWPARVVAAAERATVSLQIPQIQAVLIQPGDQGVLIGFAAARVNAVHGLRLYR
jgi:hypothetical protein